MSGSNSALVFVFGDVAAQREPIAEHKLFRQFSVWVPRSRIIKVEGHDFGHGGKVSELKITVKKGRQGR
jgi:hypothetical protein